MNFTIYRFKVKYTNSQKFCLNKNADIRNVIILALPYVDGDAVDYCLALKYCRNRKLFARTIMAVQETASILALCCISASGHVPCYALRDRASRIPRYPF